MARLLWAVGLLLAVLFVAVEADEGSRGYARQLESKDEPKDEPKDEHKDEPKDEPKDEHKDEPTDEHKDEPKDEPKEEESKEPAEGAPAKEKNTENDAVSILRNLWLDVRTRLESHSFQWFNALMAFIIGGALLVDSKHSFRVVVVVSSALLACVLSQSELSTVWHTDHREALSLFVGLQISVLAAYAVHVGMEGMLIVIVGFLGCFFAFILQEPLILWGVTQLKDRKWVVAVYYSIFAWIGLYLYQRKMHRPVLAILCSLIGGGLVTSAIAWTATVLYMRCIPNGKLHPAGGTWLDFCLMLVFSGDDLGLFAGYSDQHQVDVIADRILWFVLVLAGSIYQVKKLSKELESTASAREGLTQQLLAAEV